MKERLLHIKKRLSNLREDRSRFLTVSNVLEVYSEFDNALQSVSAEELASVKPVVSECILSFSLAFSTLGFTRQPIAAYAKAITLLTLFQFMCSDPSLTPRELVTLESSIASVEDSFNEGNVDVPEIKYVNDLVAEIIAQTRVLAKRTSQTMATLPEEEYPVFSQITHLRRDILAEIATGEFSAQRLAALGEKMNTVRTHADSGVQHSEDYTGTESVSDLCSYQLKRSRILLEWFKHGVSVSELEAEDKELAPMFRRLRDMLPVLDVFVMTRRWTLRVTDLYQHMKDLLTMIPKMLLLNSETHSYRDHLSNMGSGESQKYHYLVTYMARRAWALIFKLLDTAEPVSEALSALYNQLLTMKRCLGEVQLAGGISNLRELYPYQMKLASLDNLREDGKFLVDGEVPPGQGVLNGMLAECFDMMYELKVELDEKGGGDEGDSILVDEDACSDSTGSDADEDVGVIDETKDPHNDEGFRSVLDVSGKDAQTTTAASDQDEDQLDDIPEAKE